jgi:hypothetical protein
VESELIHSPLFTQNSGDCAARKKKKEGGRTCGGFEAVLLAVADQRTAWTVVGFSSSSLRFFFFCSVLLCFGFFSVFSSVSHYAGAVINDGVDGGSGVALVAAMLTATSGSSSFLSFFVFTSKT